MSERSEPTRIQFCPSPPLVIPDKFLIEARQSVQGMSPDDFAHVKSNTVVIDSSTSRLLIDSQDPLPIPIEKLTDREQQPALLRVVRLMGGSALDGYLADMRYVTKPPIVHRSENAPEGLEESEQWEVLKTVNPLGAVFMYENDTFYTGEMELEATAMRFAECMDIYYESVAHGNDHHISYELAREHFKNDKNVL